MSLSPFRGQQTAEEILEPSPLSKLRRRIFKNHSFLIGAVILILILLCALLAPLLAPHDPYDQDLARRLINPFWHDKKTDEAFLLGTDKIGRDYLSRLIYGAQISLLIGFSTILISGVIGTALGVTAGYFGGRVDMVVNFIINTRLAMPVFLVAMAAVVAFGASLHVVILVLGLFLWDRFAVVMRSITMQARDLDYVKAARAIGCSTPYIIIREIFPNVLSSLTVVATVEMANAILLEAALSFLGFGVQAPTPSWGLMLNEGREYMFFSPWLLALPGTGLFLLVLAINLFGDGLRDVTLERER
ncbi:MAG: ABC transporter permease [Pseudomonadota bacterium]|jgi:peptide/nickel transport system permease protein|nr:ABC transporter permease [Pseudomonadota bacterium]MEC7515988.1 ABC transporter permease [Pseudomonadota bacterium]MEC7592512.1 ABC transporter permease [Pseudomonadota bacterium]MEC7675074.1 ABC transporter permease [Pseudomonadota bacterium]MEC8006320.1 ABC transporter permease [Pseudomonadota bacterium]